MISNDDSAGQGESRPPEAEDGGCLIVGIGASAGGLEAIQTLLRHMPPHDGIALVYVQHLDPTHESVLPELLARATRMPVQAVTDETPVEPRHVYVIPPNTSLTLQGGVLRLGPRLLQPDFGRPIDAFLASLATNQGDRAVGIILSGTGSDGTAGLRAIKEHGGMTIAQLPESAAYDSMPRSAIASGIVDYVLRPDEMPARLVEEALQVAGLSGQDASGTPTSAEAAVAAICDILRRRTGHDFSSYKRSTLTRRIERRMDSLQIRSPVEYLRRLEEDADEAPHLLREMLIGVTSFFRDPRAFEALAERVLPGLFEGKGEQDQVRAWVVGCATGEEVYSLAMLLAEEASRRDDSARVQIFATDIDSEVLRVARLGRYPESACRSVSPDRLERFFVREDGEYCVREELRQRCVFSAHNVLHDPPFPNLDLVSCRNLLIYLDSRIQGKVIGLFHYALRPGGALLLGTAENISGRADLFEPVVRDQRLYRRRDLPVRAPLEFPLARNPARDRSDVTPTRTSGAAPEAVLLRTLERAVLDEFTPAGMVVREDGEVVYVFGPTAKYLGPSAGAPSLNALALVRKNLRADLRRLLQTAARAHERLEARCEPAADLEGPGDAVNLVVRPFTEVDPARGLYVVVFQDVRAGGAGPAGEPARPGEDTAVRRLQYDLRETREQLQATIDELEAANQELQSSNEELLSMNEELQSANEELQSSKEEVQTINGELEAVNRELVHKVEELDTARSDLESLFEGTQVATIFLDNDLLIKRFTPTATEVFRLRPGDVGRPVTDITTRFANGDVAGEIRAVLRTLQRREVLVSRADDGTRYLMRILPYRTRQNVVDGVVATFVDVTDLKHAQEALERANDELERRVAERTAALEAANRRKDDFLAMLSHELRNPLAAIASNIHLWQAQSGADPMLARAREMAERQVDHMRHLLEDLLDTARIVRTTIELRLEPLDLAQVLRDAAELAASRATGRRHQVSVSLPEKPIPVDGDRDRLQQVIGNLLDNAQKYTPPGGHIRLSAEAAEDEAVVRVSDDGAGIPPDLLPHIFDSFVRGGRASAQGGLGLGLTLVRHLVTLHGGSVEARSAGEGEGSEFVVRLPLGLHPVRPASQAVPAKTGTAAAPSSPKRILVVDDNADAAELLALVLKTVGHEVTIANEGEAALRVATDFRPDVVLLDIGLPGMDGYETARRMRQDAALARATLVAVTGYGREEDRERAREAGFDHHLVKPVEMATMTRLLQRIASEPRGGA